MYRVLPYMDVKCGLWVEKKSIDRVTNEDVLNCIYEKKTKYSNIKKGTE